MEIKENVCFYRTKNGTHSRNVFFWCSNQMLFDENIPKVDTVSLISVHTYGFILNLRIVRWIFDLFIPDRVVLFQMRRRFFIFHLYIYFPNSIWCQRSIDCYRYPFLFNTEIYYYVFSRRTKQFFLAILRWLSTCMEIRRKWLLILCRVASEAVMANTVRELCATRTQNYPFTNW